ncbi:MAG: aminopeptidase [Clostridia bacterium]|jgi:aminopeptidase|nr:aminopeptidase [Clostridia bacterium]
MDMNLVNLSKVLVNHSVRLEKGEKVLINVIGSTAHNLVKQIVKEVYRVGGVPFIKINEPSLGRELLLNATEEQYKLKRDVELKMMKEMDAYIGIRASDNINETSDVDSEKLKLTSKIMKPVLDERVNNTKWVVLRYPNNSMAQLAGTSLESFEDFYFKVCTVDYDKMDRAMDSLKELMERTDKVRLVGKGTDLRFSIKDIPAIKCAGEYNIPDGEVFTAPVKKSVNGIVSYNAPSIYEGVTYENIVLEFKDGKIVKATSNDTERINKVFDTDEGSRYVGEFAIGVNPYITKPMKDILFDEKIMGSFHFTPGACYEEAPNGNESSVHWDLVCIQTEEYGGGEIYFDDVLIRKDGMFVLEELKCLNPENLK